MVVVSEFLHPLFQRLSYEILHLLGSRARPRRRHGEHLDRKAGVFSSPQVEVCKCPGNDYREEEEERDGPLTDGKRREVDSAFRISFLFEMRFLDFEFAHRDATFSAATRTCCPSLSRCAPSETICSPGCTPSERMASSPLKRSTLTL